MCLLLGDGGAAPDTLTEDLLSTAFRASAVSIIATSMRVLDPTDHCDLLGVLDKITFDLERRSTDVKQFSFLKSPKVFAAISEAAQETARVLSVAAKDYKKERVEFAEPALFERIRAVFIDSASRLGFQ